MILDFSWGWMFNFGILIDYGIRVVYYLIYWVISLGRKSSDLLWMCYLGFSLRGFIRWK